MKQLLNNFRTGQVSAAEIPVPVAGKGTLLIRSAMSAVSVGTERMLVEFARAGYLEKARQQPEKVRMVLDKVRTDGPAATLASVSNKLDQPIPLGYSNAGYVVDVGAEVTGFAVGDFVLSNGAHAEYVCVPKNLCAKVPEGVSAENAAYGVIASIGLQGVRLANPTLGETVVVIGLGVIGLITVQILLANGCRVIGLDLDPKKVELCRSFGAAGVTTGDGVDAPAVVRKMTGGLGADAVLLTLATKSNEPVRDAAQMSRKRGRIVLVGVTGLQLDRNDFYEKELSFQVSCSYGPGRYDEDYEARGQDYPPGFVRWTEQRNFQAVLGLMAQGKLDCRRITTETIDFESVDNQYPALFNKPDVLGALIRYPDAPRAAIPARTVHVNKILSRPVVATPRPGIAVVGAGAFASQVLLPALRHCDASLLTVVSAGGVSGSHQARKHGFERSTTDFDTVLEDSEVDGVVIASRHNQHASMVCACLEAGKSVYVEKPLALSLDELREIETAYEAAARDEGGPILMVGYNRRFSPHVVRAKQMLAQPGEPLGIVYLVNAGSVPADHWVQSKTTGGGRIIGEGCHMLDLMMHLASSDSAKVDSVSVVDTGTGVAVPDTVSLSFSFANGSSGTLHYFANGARSFPKERITVFGGGRVIEIDNFRRLHVHGGKARGGRRAWTQDKGHGAALKAFTAALASGTPSPTPMGQIMSGAEQIIRASDLAEEKMDSRGTAG